MKFWCPTSVIWIENKARYLWFLQPAFLTNVVVGFDQARKGKDVQKLKVGASDKPCSHNTFFISWPFPAWRMVRAKRKLENGEMWFSCKSRPQRCIFQHKDVFPDRRDVFSNSAHCHFPHQAGARSLLQTGLLPGKQEKGGKKWGSENYKKKGQSPIESTCLEQAE